jgi:thioester reductase-like protein
MEEKNDEKSNKINVIETHSVINLAKKINAKKLHFISTAYAAKGVLTSMKRLKNRLSTITVHAPIT